MQRDRVIAILFISTLSIFLFTSAGQGVCQNKPLVLVTGQWPPFRISDETRPFGLRGIDIDLASKTFQTLGLDITIERHPWARCLALMRSGMADLTSGIAYTAERDQYLLYVPVSYYTVRPVFYAQKGKSHILRKYDDLYGFMVGYVLGSAYFEPFNSDFRISKIGVSKEAQLIPMLRLGRVDVSIGTEPNLSYDIARLGYKGALEPTQYQPQEETELFFAISRKSPAVSYAQKIERILEQFVSDGVVDEIVNEYRQLVSERKEP
ncbi:transporter substrate-binding domain-containing protein [uncultured Desulfosarcina sp.]|uniref:substrate-binding periplasmic protein n=1 Tax=uncultured Desulfosarcina sp. TaxID=218289 RepID=UPI0029C99345|nr:transporter substrate-binding domain-containing protein [uncultured Desulfosarcina sp.]